MNVSGHRADQSVIYGNVPLSPIQKWFFEKITLQPFHFNQSLMLYSEQQFTGEEVRAVFTKIQEHHDALRMSYNEEEGHMTQTGHRTDYPFSLEVVDYRHYKNLSAAREALERK
ncbi:MAG: hypothetical protein GY757_27240, partial [bacterium]|nr:hypothetical protein [bacterium]